MARAYASIVINAPVEAVWPLVRDFNSLPKWAPAIAKSKIEGSLDADVVGCVRSFHTHDGGHIRERLLMLDDARYCFSYVSKEPESAGQVVVFEGMARFRLERAAGGLAGAPGALLIADYDEVFDRAPGMTD